MKTTKKDRDYLIAMALGDGWLSKNGHLEVWHSESQEEWALYKYNLVRKFCPSGVLRRTNSYGNRQVGFRTKRLPFLKLLRRILYPNGKKVYSSRLLNRLGLEHLAIIWSDDGSMSNYKTCRQYTLSTCCSREECDIVIDWIRELTGASFHVISIKKGKYFSLRANTKVGREFSKKIAPFLVESMLYKVSTE